MKKLISIIMTAALLLGVFAGCGSTETTDNGATGGSDTEKKVKDTITLVTEAEPETLDPRKGNTVANNIIQTLIFDALISMDDDNVFHPRLATEWDFIDDTHLRFKLRENVKFSNGYDFTAEDVLYSFARTKLDSTSISTMAWYDDVNSYAEDDHTVVLAMNYPYAPALQVLTGGRTWIGSKQAIEEMGEDAYARNPVGTGPYVLDTWTTGASISLKANDTYWGDAPKTSKLLFNIVAEPNSRVIALETGEADFAYYINGSDMERVNAISGYHIESGPSCKYYTVCLNMQNEKFSDPKVREALSLAIDMDALVDAGFDGTATVMQSCLPSKVEGAKNVYGDGWEYNPEKAKQLLQEAGVTNLSFELHIMPTAEFQKLAEIIQSFWQEIGVTTNIEQSTVAAREAQGPWEASIRNGNATEVTGILIIYDSAFASRIGSNDAALDAMLLKLQQTYDEKDRLQQISDLQDYIYKIRYTIPFAEVDTIFGVNDKIENYKFSYNISHANIQDWVVYE
ncbi:MAG: ABC transporter substrate-binding protein [Clostridiaceae bacterium]|nr:ABC transporter substrate-binding protein [Clostridiaceae bacterium]